LLVAEAKRMIFLMSGDSVLDREETIGQTDRRKRRSDWRLLRRRDVQQSGAQSFEAVRVREVNARNVCKGYWDTGSVLLFK
jgi:hypothetical protein